MGTPHVRGTPFYRGAEADLYVSRLGPWDVIVKKRVRKMYRNSVLDARIRRDRTAKEAMVLHRARSAGVRTPIVLDVDLQADSITMTKVDGKVARNILDSIDSPMARGVFQELGREIGLLHEAGIVHGDLTTSNIIIASGSLPFVLDFGMSSHSSEVEDRGVDIHLLRKSITTSHTIDPEACARAVLGGYKQAVGPAEAKRTFGKAAEISRRGRYFAIR